MTLIKELGDVIAHETRTNLCAHHRITVAQAVVKFFGEQGWTPPQSKGHNNGLANWTYDDEAGAWYFALQKRRKPPFMTQRHVEAIIDLDDTGCLAGVEILEPIKPSENETP